MPADPSTSYAQPAPKRAEAAPSMELFDAPPKSTSKHEKSKKPGFFSRMFSSKSRSSIEREDGSIPSAPPEEEEEEVKRHAPSSSSAPTAPKGPKSESHVASSSSAPTKDPKSKASSSASAKPVKSPFTRAQPQDPEFAASRSDLLLLRNVGTPAHARGGVRLMELPPRLMPPHYTMMAGSQAWFLPAELRYPFIIASMGDIIAKFNEWSRTLWFLAGVIAPTTDIRPLLIPAFTLDGDIEISYKAIAKVRVANGSVRPGSSHSASNAANGTWIQIPVEGTLKVRGYHACFSSISSTAISSSETIGDPNGLTTSDGYVPTLAQVPHFKTSVVTDAAARSRNHRAQQEVPSRISSVPAVTINFMNLLELCAITDLMPDRIKANTGFFASLFSSTAPDAFKLEEFPEPLGTLLEHEPAWFSKWMSQCGGGRLANHPAVVAAVQTDIRSRKNVLSHSHSAAPSGSLIDVSHADVTLSAVTFKGFHSITLMPIRVPVYLGLYTCPSAGSERYAFAMSGQTGEVHDNAERPLNPVGKLTKAFFWGAFSK